MHAAIAALTAAVSSGEKKLSMLSRTVRAPHVELQRRAEVADVVVKVPICRAAEDRVSRGRAALRVLRVIRREGLICRRPHRLASVVPAVLVQAFCLLCEDRESFCCCHGFFFLSFFVAVFGLSRRPGLRASGKTAACAACLVRCLFWPLSPADRVPAWWSGQLRAAAPFGRVSRAGRASPRVSPFRRLVRPLRGRSGCCAVFKVRGGRGRRLSAAARRSSAVPGRVRRVPRGVSHPLVVVGRRRRSWRLLVVVVCRAGASAARRGVACLILSRRGRSSSRRVCAAAHPCRGGPAAGLVGACRPACAGGPIWLVRGGLRRRVLVAALPPWPGRPGRSRLSSVGELKIPLFPAFVQRQKH